MPDNERTIEERVADLENDAIEASGRITDLAGLLRRVTGHQSTVADSWFKVVTSHEFPRVLQLSGTPVADIACPKCGTNGTRISYCDSREHWRSHQSDDKCGGAEHFHRSCSRCGYAWRTDDVRGVKEAKLDA